MYVKIASIETIEGFEWSATDEDIVEKMKKVLKKLSSTITINDINIETKEIE